MKILLATDGTKYGDAAVAMLGNVRLRDGDTVKIISVIDMAMPLAIDIYGGYIPDTTELEKIARDNAQKFVAEAIEKARHSFDGAKVALSDEILFGSPDSRIVETAEEMHADLIIIGSHGYKNWERLLLGSVSNSVIHHAHCSVMVVRTPAE